MNQINKKCKECGELLDYSQYACNKKEGELVKKAEDDLVCRNQNCPKAEKNIDFTH